MSAIMKLDNSQEKIYPISLLESLQRVMPRRMFEILQSGTSWLTNNKGKALIALGMFTNGVAISYYFNRDHSHEATLLLSHMQIDSVHIMAINEKLGKTDTTLNRASEAINNSIRVFTEVINVFFFEIFCNRVLKWQSYLTH